MKKAPALILAAFAVMPAGCVSMSRCDAAFGKVSPGMTRTACHVSRIGGGAKGYSQEFRHNDGTHGGSSAVIGANGQPQNAQSWMVGPPVPAPPQ